MIFLFDMTKDNTLTLSFFSLNIFPLLRKWSFLHLSNIFSEIVHHNINNCRHHYILNATLSAVL